GNSSTNRAWPALLGSSPLQVSEGAVNVGGKTLNGAGLAVLFVQPRPGSAVADVGVVGGTDLTGMRLTDRLPVFISGVAYPDWIVLDPTVLTQGVSGVLGAGYFNNRWQWSPGDAAWGGQALAGAR
ncbi:MAG: hypothetical protein KGK12_11715, partial [Armatimonadetes bacterium]|nr:hypothetical protein [Armatimonadota bacterium]